MQVYKTFLLKTYIGFNPYPNGYGFKGNVEDVPTKPNWDFEATH